MYEYSRNKKQVTLLGKRMVELDVKKIKQESEYYDLFLVKSEKSQFSFDETRQRAEWNRERQRKWSDKYNLSPKFSRSKPKKQQNEWERWKNDCFPCSMLEMCNDTIKERIYFLLHPFRVQIRNLRWTRWIDEKRVWGEKCSAVWKSSKMSREALSIERKQ